MPSTYCCIDIEASGPVPALYDIVSLGAVAVTKQSGGKHAISSAAASGRPAPFYVEFAPQGGMQDPDAMAIHGLTAAHLEANGVGLADGLLKLNAWAESQRTSASDGLVFVGHNAVFDWSFVNYAYVRTGVQSPWGWKALDTKALAMGVLGLDWFDTNKERLATLIPALGDQDESKVHRADYDALYQAKILIGLLDAPRL